MKILSGKPCPVYKPHLEYCCVVWGKSSFSYSGALVWNSIPLWIKHSSTIES